MTKRDHFLQRVMSWVQIGIVFWTGRAVVFATILWQSVHLWLIVHHIIMELLYDIVRNTYNRYTLIK